MCALCGAGGEAAREPGERPRNDSAVCVCLLRLAPLHQQRLYYLLPHIALQVQGDQDFASFANSLSPSVHNPVRQCLHSAVQSVRPVMQILRALDLHHGTVRPAARSARGTDTDNDEQRKTVVSAAYMH